MSTYLYESLLACDYDPRLFEWLIIDDGSTVDPKSTIDGFADAPFDIRYVRQEHGGIHVAYNRSIKESQGEFVTRIDSDDVICPNAMRKMDEWIEYLKKDTGSFPEDIIGVAGLCKNKHDDDLRSGKFPEDMQITTGIALRKSGYGRSDYNFCMRTEIMREFLIPELPGTSWVPEGIIWNRIDRKYKTLFVNDIFSICTEPNEGSFSGSFGDSLVQRTSSNCMSHYYGALYSINEASDTLTKKQYLRKFITLWVNIMVCKEKKAPVVLGELKGRHRFMGFLTYLPCRIYVGLKRIRKH